MSLDFKNHPFSVVHCNNQPSDETNNFISDETYHNLDSFSISNYLHKDSNNNNEYSDTSSNSFNFMNRTIPLDDLRFIFIKTKNSFDEMEDDIVNVVENERQNITKKDIFKIKVLLQRGRKREVKEEKRKNNRIHRKNDIDNLLIKIQAHFLNFLINLTNDTLKAKFGKDTSYNFKKIPYCIKKNVKYDFFHKLKNSSIKDILQLEISKKFKTFDKDINKETFNNIYGSSNCLDDFLKMKYTEAFIFYYSNIKAPLHKITFKDKEIILSSKTKSFYYLLKKNDMIKKDLIIIVNKVYFNRTIYSFDKDSFAERKSKIGLKE